MDLVKKIAEVVSLKKFKPVIEIKGVNDKEKSELFNDYIITEEIVKNFETILEEMTLYKSPEKIRLGEDINPAEVKRAFLLRGAYGTGKSYFLLMLSTMLEDIANGNLDKVKEKFSGFDGVIYQIDKLAEIGNYFVVNINGVSETNIEFEDVIRKGFISKCREDFADYTTDSMYEVAVKKLKEDKNSPRWSILSQQLDEMSLDLEQLVSGLKKYKRNYLNKYKELLENAYNAKVDIYDSEFDVFIKESTKFIKNKGYKGIVFIFDEFSAYLTSIVEDGKINKNLAKVQELAQACYLSNANDIVFMASIHKSLSVLLTSTILSKEELDKVSGRFRELPIELSEGNELIKDTINIDEYKYQLMRSDYEEVKYVENITNEEIQNYYPIHPSALYYLNTLSKIYSQENRTVFRFLSDVVDRKIKTEDIIVSDGRLNLVTIDYLYDYFIEDASEGNMTIVKSANDALRECSEEWQKKVVKCLIVSRLSVYDIRRDSSIKIGLSTENISNYLLIKDAKILGEFLQCLSSKTNVNIFYNKHDDVYEFYESFSSKINLEKEKEEAAKKVNEYDEFIELIRKKSRNKDFFSSSIKVAPLTGVTPVPRDFSSMFYTYSDLIDAFEGKKNLNISADGNIIYLLPRYFEVENISKNEVKKHIIKHENNIVVGFPKKYDFNREIILDYGAYKKMLRDEKLIENEEIIEYLNREKDKYEELLLDKINEYTDIKNFIFIFNNNEELEFSSIYNLYAYILKRHYYKFPNIEMPINDRGTTNKIIKAFVAPREKEISRNATSEEDRHVKGTMFLLDLAKISKKVAGNVKAELKIPQKENSSISAEIFEIVCNNEKDKVFDILERAPYGMPEFLIEFYIGCAASLGKVNILKSGKLEPVSSEALKYIKNNASVEIKKVDNDLDLDELQYAKKVWAIIGKNIDSRKYNDFKPEKGVKDKIGLMLDIVQDIKVFLNKLQHSINVLKQKGFNLNYSIKLQAGLEKLCDFPEPEKYIKTLNEIPSRIFDNKDREKALKQFDDLIIKLSKIMDNTQIYNVLSYCMIIEENKYKFENFKPTMKLYNEIIELEKKLLNDPLNFNDMNKLIKLTNAFFQLYNNRYKELHKNLYDKIMNIKKEIAAKPEEQLIASLEKFKFFGIRNSEEIYKNMRERFNDCNNDFKDELSTVLYNCKCMGLDSTLDDFQTKYELFMEEVEECGATISGILLTYREEFLKLDKKTLDKKKSLRAYIKDKDEQLLDTYMNFMNYINDNPVKNIDYIVKNSDSLSKIILEYKKHIEKENGINKDKVSIDKITTSVNSAIKHTGKAYITKKEYLEIIKDILDKKVGDKFILIRD